MPIHAVIFDGGGVLDRLRVQPAEAIFVDDVQENVEAAQAMGMAGVRFVSTEQTMADIEQYLKV